MAELAGAYLPQRAIFVGLSAEFCYGGGVSGYAILVWFRMDYALTIIWRWPPPAASRRRGVPGAVYRFARKWRQHHMAPRQAALYRQPLRSLHAALAERGIPLLVEEADNFAASIELLTRICKQHQVSHLFYNYQYEFNERQRDAGVEKILKEAHPPGV